MFHWVTQKIKVAPVFETWCILVLMLAVFSGRVALWTFSEYALSTLEIDVYVWYYALLVVLARNDDDDALFCHILLQMLELMVVVIGDVC